MKAFWALIFVSVLLLAETNTGSGHVEGKKRTNDDEISLEDQIRRSPLVDRIGVEGSLSSIKTSTGKKPKGYVLFFGMMGCPATDRVFPSVVELEKKFRKDNIAFVALSSNESEDLSDIASASIQNQIPFPIRKDYRKKTGTTQQPNLADILGVKEVPTFIFLDENYRVKYQGLFDDTAQMAIHKEKADNPYLERALIEFLSGKNITEPVTEASGCPVQRTSPSLPSDATYVGDVENIFKGHCIACHRPGGTAPTSFTSYDEIIKYGEAIKKVLLKGMMPPHYAHSRGTRPLTSPTLSPTLQRRLLGWIQSGMPLGKGVESITTSWSEPGGIGQPDRFVTLSKEHNIPAKGSDEFVTTKQLLTQDGDPIKPSSEDLWITGVQVYPGAARSVHEVRLVAVDPKSAKRTIIGYGNSSGNALTFSQGAALLLPKGNLLELETHYSPHGIQATDYTSVGLKFTDRPPATEAHVELMQKKNFKIPPQTPFHMEQMEFTFEKGSLLKSVIPIANSRAIGFRYELLEKGKPPTVLLTLPRYDPRIKQTYSFQTPMETKKGTTLRVTAFYDHSANNSQDADPSIEVKAGPTFSDERFESLLIYTTNR